MENKQKLFAFKVVAKEQVAKKNDVKWSTREGVAAAGCTDPNGLGNVRYTSRWGGRDAGVYC